MQRVYLGGGPVDPAFAVGVDVEQHQTFHQVREDQLESKGDMRAAPLTKPLDIQPQHNQTHSQLGQNVGASPDSDPNDALEPAEKENGADYEGFLAAHREIGGLCGTKCARAECPS